MKLTDKIEVFNCDNMELMAKYDDNHFDLAIVDPPYGIGEDGGKSESRCKKTGVKPTNYTKKGWDFKASCAEYFKELKRVSVHQIIWGANHFIENIPQANSSCWIVWDKDNGLNDFADCELAYCSFKTAVRRYRFKWHGMLQENMKHKEVRIHPTQKPVKLYQWLLEKYAKPDFKVFDSHLGSGSHAIAAHYFGCEFVGCEIDKDYFNDFLVRFKHETAQLKMF